MTTTRATSIEGRLVDIAKKHSDDVARVQALRWQRALREMSEHGNERQRLAANDLLRDVDWALSSLLRPKRLETL